MPPRKWVAEGPDRHGDLPLGQRWHASTWGGVLVVTEFRHVYSLEAGGFGYQFHAGRGRRI